MMTTLLRKIFPACSGLLPARFWQGHAHQEDPQSFPDRVAAYVAVSSAPGYLPDLARVELARYQLKSRQPLDFAADAEGYLVNPNLALIQVDWQPLLPLLDGQPATPQPTGQALLFWRHPQTGRIHEEPATAADLLALKIVVERLDPLVVARETQQPVGLVDAALDQASERGLLLPPPSRLCRDFPAPAGDAVIPDHWRIAKTFTLQWHITHRCDLHCRHCYDRSLRADVALDHGLDILDQMRDFCRMHQVFGQVSFSGGNPFLHPGFLHLYRAAHERNLSVAILGNPVSASRLDELLQIAWPSFFQVSLEGLQEHNDRIRGKGSFTAVVDFLDLLRDRQVYSMVMLTLTRANLDQVLPLAQLLRDRVDLFTFNRLAMVGEGANLESPGPEEYRAFLADYLKARETNPAIALKDSLINILLEQNGHGPFGGCTGFGCGAAFNFVSLLPDGQVHACRKFPSLIGDTHRQSLDEIYHGAAAAAYRRGCRQCDDCRLRAVCGGCLAVTCGYGLDPLAKKDPACFIDS